MAKPHSPGQLEEQLASGPSPANDYPSLHVWKSPIGTGCVSLTFSKEMRQRKRLNCVYGSKTRSRRKNILVHVWVSISRSCGDG